MQRLRRFPSLLVQQFGTEETFCRMRCAATNARQGEKRGAQKQCSLFRNVQRVCPHWSAVIFVAI